MKTTQTARSAKPYTPAALFRVYDKQTDAVLGYLAPSRNGKDFYHVTCDEYGVWHCDCAATKPCCHIKAASELCEIRAKDGRPAHRQPMAEVATQEVAPDVDESNEEAKLDGWANEALMLHAPLNGNRRDGRLLPPPVQAPTPLHVNRQFLMRV